VGKSRGTHAARGSETKDGKEARGVGGGFASDVCLAVMSVRLSLPEAFRLPSDLTHKEIKGIVWGDDRVGVGRH